jgi:hypothetical protein
MNNKKSSNTTCLYVALGCGGALVLIALVLGGLGFWGAQKVKQFEADLKDPAAREEKVMGILGTETLPDGYYPMMGITFPFVFDMAMLTREPIPEGEDPEGVEPSFIYMKMLSFGKQDQELKDFFNGTNDNPSVLRDNNINVNIDDVVNRGELQVGDQNILWLASRDRIQTGATRSSDLSTIMMIRCPNDQKTRLGIWLASEDPENNEDGTPKLEGTVGDPEKIESFMGHFSVC